MKKFEKVLFGVIGFFVFAALPLAQAQNTPGPQEHAQVRHFDQRIQEIFKQIGLTDSQKKQLEVNKKQHQERMKSIWQQIKTNREALRDELMKPQMDMPKITALQDQIKILQSQIEDIKLSSILTVRTILTTEQFTKFINLMPKPKHGHEE